MKDFPKVAQILVRTSSFAIEKILKIFNEEITNPLARAVALRRWKNGYGLPPRIEKYGGEIYALGRIHRSILGEAKAPKRRSDVGLVLSPQDATQIKNAFTKAAIWVYSRWAPFAMAKVLVQGGGFDNIDSYISEYRMIRNIHLNQRMEYRSLLAIMFGK
jgi:hypothetical protein